MNVYVESNFPLELARQQESAAEAEHLLDLAERGAITLIFPVFCICEPFSTLTHYSASRGRLVEAMRPHIRDLGRSRPQRALAEALQHSEEAVLGVWRTEVEGLTTAIRRMLAAGRAIGLTTAIFDRATELASQLDLLAQDAIVLASVLTDLQAQSTSQASCFVSRNSKDFDDPTVKTELAGLRCTYVSAFADAIRFTSTA